MARRVSNAAGLERTLKALELQPAYGALIAAARTLAIAVDADPGNAALWREYRSVVASLLEGGASDANDESASFLQLVRAPMVDAANS